MAIDVRGHPAPQGSKRTIVNKSGKVSVIESSARVKPWRQAVIDAADGSGYADYPVAVTVDFYLERPKGHYGTGRNKGNIRAGAAEFPVSRGRDDLDKLVRATLDALTMAGCWADDSQVVTVHARKLYADGRPPGAHISIDQAAS